MRFQKSSFWQCIRQQHHPCSSVVWQVSRMWSSFLILVFQNLHLIWWLIYLHRDNFYFTVTRQYFISQSYPALQHFLYRWPKPVAVYIIQQLDYSPTKSQVCSHVLLEGSNSEMWFLTIIKKPAQKLYWSFLEIHRILNYQRNTLLLKTREFAQYLGLSSAFWWRIFCVLLNLHDRS